MPICDFKEGCHLKAVLITGDCKYCKLKFCNKHRLPESHYCENLQSCKDAHFQKNKEKLEKESLQSVCVEKI